MSNWTRPPLAERVPNRNIGGLARTADIDHNGTTLAGVPMQTVSDAVIATVKLGYKVADTQIARGRRVGRSLKGAAQRAGAKDANVVIDNTERLLAQAVGLGLEWLESAATAEQGPVRRVLKSEYRLIGRVLGLLTDEAVPASTGKADAAASSKGDNRPAAERSAEHATDRDTERPTSGLLVRHRAVAEQRRDVQIVRATWRRRDDRPITVHFHHRNGERGTVLAGTLERANGRDVLALTTTPDLPSGVWRAAVCDADGLQIGTLEIEL